MPARKRNGHLATVLLLVVALVAGAFAWGLYAPALPREQAPVFVAPPVIAAPLRVSSTSGTYFDHIVIILMENHAICSILTTCGGAGPYETQLATAYGLARSYVKCTTPSLPNYLCLTGGSSFGCTGYDGAPHSNTCTNVAWNSPNIWDRLAAAGLSFKAYMESMPSNCDISTSGNYAVKHNPFVYYSDNVNNATRCNLIVPSGTNGSVLLSDLASTSTATNYMWLTPNLCNDMHDCSVATGDNYLKGLVPKILNSTVFKTTRAALFITFDEDSGTSGAPDIYTVWAGPAAKTAYVSTNSYNHFSLLSTLESNWNLPPLTVNDTNAPNMDEFLVASSPESPVARFSHIPVWPKVSATITFNASTSSDPSPNTILQYRWDWTNDGIWDTGWSTNPLATHAYASAGSYTVHLQVEDNLGHEGNATSTVVADSEPPMTTSTGTGTSGNNGWYRSAVAVKLTATDDLSGVAFTKYRQDSGSWATYTSQFSVSGDGSHSVNYYSVDNAANTESTHTLTIKIDTVAPVTTATLQGNLVNGSYYQGPVNVTLAGTDATSGVAWTKYRVDNGTWTTYSSKVTVSGNGTHIFYYYSQDNAGNTESTKSVAVFIGFAPGYPVTTLSLEGTAGKAGWYRSDVTLTLNATDPAGAMVTIADRVDNGSWQAYTSPIVLLDGQHSVDYEANDSLGRSEAMKVITVDVDTMAPTLQILGPSGTVTTSEVAVSWFASDGLSGLASIQVSVDGGPFQAPAAGGNLSVRLPDGNHYVTVKAEDVAGNMVVKAATFTVDTNPFSPNGPMLGAPLYAIIGLTPVVLGIATLLLLHRRRRRRHFSR